MKVAIITTDLRDDHRRYSEPEPSFGTAPTALLQGFAQTADCEVHVISCVQQPVASPARIFGGLHYHSVHVKKRGWLRGAYLGCILGVRKKLREIHPDIVHGQGTERYCALSAVFSGFPNVVTIHGNMTQVARLMGARPFSFHWITSHLENFALSKTAGVFCNSEYTRRVVGTRTEKSWLVPNAVRSCFFSPPMELPHSSPPVLLNLGTVIAYKNQIKILGVCRKLYERGLRFEMRFAGRVDNSTSYGPEFMRQIREAEAKGYARYIGFIDGEELVPTFDAASGMVHCPREEAFGLVVAEGLARNLKFFGSRIGGVPDIASGVAGAELFEPEDWLRLEKAMANWIESGAPRPTMAAAEMRARYEPETIARRHIEIYTEALGD